MGILLLASCATEQSIPGARADLLSFLTTKVTTRTEVLLHLGQPSSTLEQERILTYRIGGDTNKGLFLLTPPDNQLRAWDIARYSLVLVFDREGVLEAHSLVLVK